MLTRKEILEVYNYNVMMGVIETGWRCWITQHLSWPLKSKTLTQEKMKYLRELTEVAEISCYPMEETRVALRDRIKKIVEELFKLQTKFPTLESLKTCKP